MFIVTGKGVFAERFFKKGEFLLEYDGDLISHKEGGQRLEKHSKRLGCYVFFFRSGGKNYRYVQAFQIHVFSMLTTATLVILCIFNNMS